jgi:hypothetical protein
MYVVPSWSWAHRRLASRIIRAAQQVRNYVKPISETARASTLIADVVQKNDAFNHTLEA